MTDKDKMNVLLVAPFGGVPGGISRWTGHIVDYYSQLEGSDVDMDLVPMGRSSFVNVNTPFVRRVWKAWVDYRAILKDYSSKLKSKPYDLVHLTSSGSLSLFKDLYMLRKAKRQGAKTVLHFHFGRIPELAQRENWEWRMVKKVVREADRVAVLDKDTYYTLLSAGYDHVDILANPVAAKVEKIVSTSPKEITSRLVLFAGHVVPSKGVYELIEAFKDLDNDVRLKIIGTVTPEMRQSLSSMISAQEANRVEICGEKPYDEVIKAMIACDVFVLPTYTEGFPNVILESMAAGCAIVTTPVGAIPQILEPDEHGEYGILVPPRNADALREALALLLGDDERKTAMRKNVKRRVMERYNIDAIWGELTNIWHKTIEDRK